MYHGAIFHGFSLYCKCLKLTYTEKQRIVADLAEGPIFLDLTKKLQRNKER